MTNSELAKHAYEVNEQIYEIATDAFNKYREAGLINKHYSFDKYELDATGMEITGDHYSCGDTDYESFHIPYADLDNIDAFIERRKTEVAEQKRQAEAKNAAIKAQQQKEAEDKERQQFLKLKEKFEGVTK